MAGMKCLFFRVKLVEVDSDPAGASLLYASTSPPSVETKTQKKTKKRKNESVKFI